jgi:hypothetical protein
MRRVGILPLMVEIKVDVARTDISHKVQLLMSPARCSLLMDMVVRVQGSVPMLAVGTHGSKSLSHLLRTL